MKGYSLLLMKISSLLCVFSFLIPASGRAESLPWEPRAWKNEDGKILNAALVNWEASKIKLRLANGTDSEVQVNFLSPEDQKFLAGEKDRLTKQLKTQLKAAEAKAAAPKPAAAPAKPGTKPAAAPPASSKSSLSLASQTAGQVYRIGVPVPGPGGGAVAKVAGKVEAIALFKANELETIVVELEGGVAIAAGAHETIFGGPKLKLRLEKDSIIQYPQPPPSEDGAKAASPLPPVRLFGVGDTVTISGQVYFVPEKVGTKSNYFVRGASALVGVNKPVVFATPKINPKAPPKVDPKKPAPKKKPAAKK